MGIGKYSPTVSSSYAFDQEWWERNGGGFGNGNNPDSDDDNDGYDSYGYSDRGMGPDRLGYKEMDYMTGYEIDRETGELYYHVYDGAEADSRGKLLGDLNEYIHASHIADAHNLDHKKLKLYSGYLFEGSILQVGDNKISQYLQMKGYIHESKVEDLVQKYNQVVLGQKPNKSKKSSPSI